MKEPESVHYLMLNVPHLDLIAPFKAVSAQYEGLWSSVSPYETPTSGSLCREARNDSLPWNVSMYVIPTRESQGTPLADL